MALSLEGPFEETACEAEFSQTFLHTCMVTKAAASTRGLAFIHEDLFPACVCVVTQLCRLCVTPWAVACQAPLSMGSCICQ